MHPGDFIRSKLLDRQRKFIGLVSFPDVYFASARREILQWVLLREQEIARLLGRAQPASLPVQSVGGTGADVMISETDNQSLIEFAVSADLTGTGAALRYFHFMTDRKRTADGVRNVQVDKEGFVTTFVFQRNAAEKRIYLWVRLEYCHSKLWPSRKMPDSTPRIFNQILKRIPTVKLVVHERSPNEVIAREWQTSSSFEEIESAVKHERRSAARKGEKSVPVEVEQTKTDVLTLSGHPQVGLQSLLDGLHDAVESLRKMRTTFFGQPEAGK